MNVDFGLISSLKNLEQLNIINQEKYIIISFDPKGDKVIYPFLYRLNAYIFLIPEETISLVRYDEAYYVGEVGSCYPANPNVLQGISLETRARFKGIIVDTDYFEALKEKNGYKDIEYTSSFLINQSVVSDIYRFIETKDDSIIENLLNLFITTGLNNQEDRRKESSKYYLNIAKSIQYMMDNYQNPNLTIEEVSAQTNYAYTYFIKAFKKYIGDTPINHLNKIRISKAKELMKNKNLSIDEISRLTGYNNPSSLTEAFKRIMKMTPLKYRKKYL